MILGIIQILLALAMIIAVLGVINTLVLSVIERTRELGLLRAVGLSRAQTTRMITVESVVISLFGALLGVAVGAGLGAAAVQGPARQGHDRHRLPVPADGDLSAARGRRRSHRRSHPSHPRRRLNVLAAIAYE